MSDLTTIDKALSAIETTKKIYKAITQGVEDLKNLEVRSKFIELKSALLDSEETILSIKQEFDKKDEEIIRLKNALKLKSELVLYEHHGHYHKADENGEPYGVPYCSRCWEVENIAVSVTRKSKCPQCKGELWRALALPIVGKKHTSPLKPDEVIDF